MLRLGLVVMVLAGVLAAVPATMTAAAAKPSVCRKATVKAALLSAGKLTEDDFTDQAGIATIRCGDVTADGRSDALFSIASGGTAGAVRFGVLRGRANGSAGKLVLYRQGYKLGVAIFDKHSFEVLQPHYGAKDPNCCPSSFRITRYTWTGHHFRAGKAVKRKKAPARFYQ